MSRWFRLYDDLVGDPKVQRLPPVTFKHLINLWCIASKSGGILPDFDQIAYMLRVTRCKVDVIIDQLAEAGLIDKTEVGLTPHNWPSRQYQSDSSAERVRRHREKRIAAGLIGQWTAPKQLRQAVYERDEYQCVYCGSGENLSLDHRTPEIRGGNHNIENLATACQSCNGAKRDLTEQEFRDRSIGSNSFTTLPKRPRVVS